MRNWLIRFTVVMLISNSMFVIFLKGETVKFGFTGDMMLGTDFPDASYLPPNKARGLFKGVESAFEGLDILMGNLEGVLANRNTQTTKRPGKLSFSFRMPPLMSIRLKEAGFGLINLANNHANDFGKNGITQTISLLKKQGIIYTGLKRQYGEMIVKGLKVRALGFSTSPRYNSIFEIQAMSPWIKYHATNCDILIVTFHGGAEGEAHDRVPKAPEYFYKWPRGDVYRFSHNAVDQGADLVIGHGPHVLRGMEVYKGKLIAYSLGNFIGYKRFSTKGKKGYSCLLKAEVNAVGDWLGGQLIPITLTNSGLPQIDRAKQGIAAINRLNKLDFPNNLLLADSDGFLSKKHE